MTDPKQDGSAGSGQDSEHASSKPPLPERNVCSVCGKTAPETETDYTLISGKHGWRLSIHRTPDGRRASFWICKTCWDARPTPAT